MTRKITKLLIITTIILEVVQVCLASNLSAESSYLDFLEKKKESLLRETLTLEEKIASLSSLKVIQEEAIKLGFKTNNFLIDYSSEESVAMVGR